MNASPSTRETLWTGGPGSSTSYNGGNNETKGQNGATLRALNKQLANGAETVNPGNLTGGENAAEQGNYLNWGDIFLDYGFNDATVTEYRRDLNLSKGKADVTFKHDGVTYTRANTSRRTPTMSWSPASRPAKPAS